MAPRKDLKLADKIKIIELVEGNGTSVKQCVDLFKCGKSAVYNVLKRKAEWKEEYESGKFPFLRVLPKLFRLVQDDVEDLLWQKFYRKMEILIEKFGTQLIHKRN